MNRLLASPQFSEAIYFIAITPIVLLIYFFAIWDARNPERQSDQRDTQIGFKVVLSSFALFGFFLLAKDLHNFLHIIFTLKFKHILKPIPGVLVGGAILLAIIWFLLPKTNSKQFPKVFRLTVGALAILGGIGLIGSVHGLLENLFNWQGWNYISRSFSGVIVFSPFAIAGLVYLAKQSGLDVVPDDIKSMSAKIQIPGMSAPIAHKEAPKTPAAAPPQPAKVNVESGTDPGQPAVFPNANAHAPARGAYSADQQGHYGYPPSSSGQGGQPGGYPYAGSQQGGYPYSDPQGGGHKSGGGN